MNRTLLVTVALGFLLAGGVAATGAVGPTVDLFEEGDQIDQTPPATADSLYLAPADSPEGTTYAELTGDDELRVEIDDLNAESVTEVDDVFVIGYAGDRVADPDDEPSARVGIDPDDLPADAAVTFVEMDTGEEIATTRSDLEEDGIHLEPGESAVVGVIVEAGTTDTILSTISILADVATADFDITALQVGDVPVDEDEEVVIRAGETVPVTTEVSNTGTEVAEGDRTVALSVEGTTDTEEVTGLGPGATQAVGLAVQTDTDDIGQRLTAEVTVEDDREGDLAIDQEQSFTVIPSTDPEYDLEIPNDGATYAVGFPGAVEEDTYAEVFDSPGTVNLFEYDPATNSFEQVGFDAEPEPLTALIVATEDTGATTELSVELTDPAPTVDTRTLQEGLNFVPATSFGTPEVAFDGSFSGTITQAFDLHQAPESDRLVQPESFTTQTGSGVYTLDSAAPAPEADPFAGYFVLAETGGTYTADVTGTEAVRDFLRVDADRDLEAAAVSVEFAEPPRATDETVAVDVTATASGFAAFDDETVTVELSTPDTDAETLMTAEEVTVTESGVIEIDIESDQLLVNEELTVTVLDDGEVLQETTTTVSA